MNRKKSVEIKKNLPFTTSEFLTLKNRVKSQVVQKQKYRCGDKSPQFKIQVIQRSISQAPSSLLQQTYIIKQNKKFSSIDPIIKIIRPVFGQKRQLKQAQIEKVKIVKFNLQQFKKTIHLQQNHLCRTCDVNKRYRPKLFKKRF